jgi:hypothetical protein
MMTRKLDTKTNDQEKEDRWKSTAMVCRGSQAGHLPVLSRLVAVSVSVTVTVEAEEGWRCLRQRASRKMSWSPGKGLT